MLCCCDGGSSSYSPIDSNKPYGVGNFPGQRRVHPAPYPQEPPQLYATGGNAMSQYDSSAQNAQKDLLSVTVPEGAYPGQTLQVAAPDGRMIMAGVPEGMQPGSTFMVEIPNNPPQSSPSIPAYSAVTGVAHSTPSYPPSSTTKNSFNSETGNTDSIPNPDQPFQYSDIKPVSHEPKQQSSPEPPLQNQMLVQVPQGAPPGSTLHVQVPGENRIIAAVVPPGVSEFHVAYSPQTAPPPTSSEPYTVPPPTAPQSHYPPAPAPTYNASAPQNNGQQSLMLVRVPPGTPPGSTLHVQIPGENRTIAAQVPPGVSEFHVSYKPASPQQQQQQQRQPMYNAQTSNHHGNGAQQANRYNNPQQQYNAQPYNNQQQQNRNYNNQQQQNSNYNNQQQQNQNGSSMGMVAAVAAPIAIAAAGLGAYEYMHHRNYDSEQNNDQENYDNSGGANYEADDGYGGGGDDGGGDFDGGGGDY